MKNHSSVACLRSCNTTRPKQHSIYVHMGPTGDHLEMLLGVLTITETTKSLNLVEIQ